MKCVLPSELYSRTVIRYWRLEWISLLEAGLDGNGSSLTSSGVAICQSFSCLSGARINHRGPQQISHSAG